MKVFKFLAPYQAPGKTTFKNTLNKSGVYIIKEAGKMVYIGSSTKNLYKTLYRHFEKWHHSGQPVTTYRDSMQRINYTVRVILCTPLQAVKLERALIIKHKPRDNENKFTNYLLKFPDVAIVEQYEYFKGEKLTDLPKDLPF